MAWLVRFASRSIALMSTQKTSNMRPLARVNDERVRFQTRELVRALPRSGESVLASDLQGASGCLISDTTWRASPDCLHNA